MSHYSTRMNRHRTRLRLHSPTNNYKPLPLAHKDRNYRTFPPGLPLEKLNLQSATRSKSASQTVDSLAPRRPNREAQRTAPKAQEPVHS